MRFLVAAFLVLSCSLCLAEDLPQDTNKIKSLTAEQAAELVAKFEGEYLFLDGLTSIDKDVAQELAKSRRGLFLGLPSIDKDVLKILKSNPNIYLPEKYPDKKD